MSGLSYFEDKVVLITGSARGIGRETARKALALGARVVLSGRNSDALEQTRRNLGTERSMAVAADLSSPAEAEYLVAATLAAWGHIDVLINNAGQSMRGRFSDLSNQTARQMLDANFLSAVWTTRSALPALRQSRGRVLFVSTLAAVHGFPEVSLYSASKMALTALAQSLRAEESEVNFGTAYLPFVENDADKTVLSADGRPFRHQRRWTLTQAGAADVLLSAIARRRRSTLVSSQGRWLGWASAMLPGFVDGWVRRSAGRVHRFEEKRP